MGWKDARDGLEREGIEWSEQDAWEGSATVVLWKEVLPPLAAWRSKGGRGGVNWWGVGSEGAP